ncbi:MAG: hypothetical protein JXE07_02935 [Candidatus Aminicenantes bacterium]|nr:hypothetical protein [Candidatus Aminicenantes bacterium]
MKNKILVCVLLSALWNAALAEDWKTELIDFFKDEHAADYRGAAAYLKEKIDALGEEDKPLACGLLAYLHARLEDRENEYQKLGEYFEKYGAIGMGFTFLPLSIRNNLLRYLRDWQLRYPWVLKIGFVTPGAEETSSLLPNPPETILLGVEMASDVYYKLLEGGNVLKGGRFHRGFNAVSLPGWKLFREPGAFPFVLEFKAGDLVIRRELIVGVQMESVGIMGKPSGSRKEEEFLLEMYFGDALLASSRRTLPAARDMEIETPPPSGKYDPFGPGYQNEPRIPSGVPIMAIPAAIMEAIKALKKKDEVEPVPPPKLKTDFLVLFMRPSSRGDDIEVRARISLGLREMRFLSYSLLDPH